MNNYVIYHSVHGMGYDYQPEEKFSFCTGKSKTFIESAMGGTVWVIKGEKNTTGKIDYHLMGHFTLEEIDYDVDEEKYIITGDSLIIEAENQPPITSLDWFLDLYKEQNNFSFGFNRIGLAHVVSELEALMEELEVDYGELSPEAVKTAILSLINEGKMTFPIEFDDEMLASMQERVDWVVEELCEEKFEAMQAQIDKLEGIVKKMGG